MNSGVAALLVARQERVASGVPRGGDRFRPFASAMIFVILGLIFALPGCGSGYARVQGEVTLDGKPVTGGDTIRGTVCFQSEDSALSSAVGVIETDGSYEMMTGTNRGVMPGTYRVTISITEIIPAVAAGEAPSGRRLSALEYASPEKSGLQVQVEPGRNVQNFEIHSKFRAPAGSAP